MEIERLTWKFRDPPTTADDFPCMVCRDWVAEFKRTMHNQPVRLVLCVCSRCAKLTDAELWQSVQP